DVLHDDVAALDLEFGVRGAVLARFGGPVGEEVADLHDVRVPGGDEGTPLQVGEGGAARTVAVAQGLDSDEVAEAGVLGEIDPALTATGDRTLDVVLLAERGALYEVGPHRVRVAALRAVLPVRVAGE